MLFLDAETKTRRLDCCTVLLKIGYDPPGLPPFPLVLNRVMARLEAAGIQVIHHRRNEYLVPASQGVALSQVIQKMGVEASAWSVARFEQIGKPLTQVFGGRLKWRTG